MLWKPTSTRIITRCRGGNTWSIPRWRSVFISLFTNVTLSRCVHYKKSTAGWITPSCRTGLQWGTCAEARLCYLNSWHSLVRHVQVCTDLRALYHIEGGGKDGPAPSLSAGFMCVIVRNRWTNLLTWGESGISTNRTEKAKQFKNT